MRVVISKSIYQNAVNKQLAEAGMNNYTLCFIAMEIQCVYNMPGPCECRKCKGV